MRRNTEKQTSYETRTVSIRPVTKVTAGGRRMRLSALVVVGDKKGRVGLGLGRAMDLRGAVEKGANIAEKNMVKIDLVGGTIPHEVLYKYRGASVLLKPAKPGTGIIAGSSVRTVLELLGVDDVYAKQLGSGDKIANAYCVFEALRLLKSERVLERMESMRARIDLKLKQEREKARKRKIARSKKYAKRRTSSIKEKKNSKRKTVLTKNSKAANKARENLRANKSNVDKKVSDKAIKKNKVNSNK